MPVSADNPIPVALSFVSALSFVFAMINTFKLEPGSKANQSTKPLIITDSPSYKTPFINLHSLSTLLHCLGGGVAEVVAVPRVQSEDAASHAQAEGFGWHCATEETL